MIKKNIFHFLILLLSYIFFHSLYFIFTFQRVFMFKMSSPTYIPVFQNYKNIDFFYVDKKSTTDLIYFHGSIISGKIYRKLLYDMAEQSNCNVLSFNIRGVFNSRGIPSEKGIKKELDDFIDFLLVRNKEYVLFGQSLGCSLAIYVNKRIPGKCILENPYLYIIK